MTVEQFLTRLTHVRSTGHDRWQAVCPAHDDARPSLSIKRGDGGQLLAYCHSGCRFDAILQAVAK